MRPAQIAREIREDGDRWHNIYPASMRPAQIAREISRGPRSSLSASCRFNEARANCAGNCHQNGWREDLPRGFNEARANCAGNSVKYEVM